MRYSFCFMAFLLMINAAAAELPRIILDTDMRGDCDDAGALGMLHALADKGACEILGVMASTTGPHVVGTIAAINAYYGRPHLPVGLYGGEGVHGADHYAPVVGDPDRFPSFISNETAPDSTALYRRLLHAAPDKSVTIVVIGGQPCVHALLMSGVDPEGDGSINRTGAALVAAKVRELVLMAGNFADPDHREWNVILDVPAAQAVARDWPTPIVYSGFEIGRDIQTGGTLEDPETNPVAMSYKLYPGTEGGAGVIGNRSSWDQTAVYYAVHGLEYDDLPVWGKAGPVSVAFTDEGHTLYEDDADANRYYLTPIMSDTEVAALLEALMVQPPRMAVTLSAPTPGAGFRVGDAVSLALEIDGRDTKARDVVYLVNNVPVARVFEAPWRAVWEASAAGTYDVRAYAAVDDDVRFYAEPVSVSVVAEDETR